MSSNPFVGTWQLRDAYALSDSGARLPSPLGERVIGLIMYDDAGNMSAQLASAERPQFSARTPNETPDPEFKSAFLSFTSYWGRYRIDHAAGTVTHTVTGASAPSWPGSEQLRYFELNGNLLTLKTPPIRGRDGVKLVQQLVWEKI
jgi:Lipocalin-like domain